MLRKLIVAALFGVAGYFGTAYALALMLPTDPVAAMSSMLAGPIPVIGGVIAAIVGCFVARR